ncbi:MAG: shikimate dehydrogenase [Robiginitomaculum sp.]|nr:shikimate dehydrogenase [Robiginitomaculum sp.]MDQ7078902.1 shikimate dehydrogenase [Robiginitomaculum sp.]
MTSTNAQIKTACVIGDPIDHSLSPLLHNYWIKALGLQAHYNRVMIKADRFNVDVTNCFKDRNFMGMNITLPHKQAALALASDASTEAKKAGAANLLIRRKGKLWAHNTDIEGFTGPLIKARGSKGWEASTIIIIGAGGAARAALIGALKLRPYKIILLNRTDAKAQALAKAFGKPVLALPWSDRQNALRGADLLVNASAAGMAGKPALDLRCEGLAPDALVYDLIYTPLETPLLAAANTAGYGVLNGLDMLIGQARPSFEAFFGVPPPADEGVKAILVKTLEVQP